MVTQYQRLPKSKTVNIDDRSISSVNLRGGEELKKLQVRPLKIVLNQTCLHVISVMSL